MPPPPPPYESASYDHMEDHGVTISFDEIEALSPSQPGRYPTAMPHDGEASGSQAPSDFADGLADSIFSTPLPPPATTMGDDDPWETASRLRREAEAAAIAASDAIWTRLGDRENRGHPAQRYSPSLFR
jgi:hypothetical protein